MDPPKWSPKPEIAHCWKCHGSDDMFHNMPSPNSQQGHMDCLLCHTDHTKYSPGPNIAGGLGLFSQSKYGILYVAPIK
jgi:hypothetical protein